MMRVLKSEESKKLRGVTCPYASDTSLDAAAKCKYTPGVYFLTLSDLHRLSEYGKFLSESYAHAATESETEDEKRENKQSLDDLVTLDDEDIKLFEDWILSSPMPSPTPLPDKPDEPLDLLIMATTKICPTGCGMRVGDHYIPFYPIHTNSSNSYLVLYLLPLFPESNHLFC